MKDHQIVFDHIDRYGEPSARRLFSNQLLDQAQHLSGLGHLDLSGCRFPDLVSFSHRPCPLRGQ
ncbi:hypothetical protein NKH18_01410 [Streptomyces sp. M10(2022)]